MSTPPEIPSSISIIIPAHNEAVTICDAVADAVRVLRSLGCAYEVLVVDDGSTDSTASRVRDVFVANGSVRLIQTGTNIGANRAIYLGFSAARSAAMFFLPADLQVRADQLLRCLPALSYADVICTRRSPRADSWTRRLLALIYNGVARRLFHLPCHDVDSVILVRREVVTKVVPLLLSHSDFLPVEFIVRARAAGFQIGEVAIMHYPRTAGSPTAVRPASVLQTMRDLALGYFRLRGA